MPENVDKELVLRLQSSDSKAFNILYWKYHSTLYTNIYRLMKEEDVTQEILQELFITLWEKRLTLNPDQAILNWLFSVSYYKCLHYLQQVTKEKTVYAQLDHDAATIEPAMTFKEIRLAQMEKAIEQLAPQRRKVFEMCKLQGKSYKATALELNLSIHTVKEYLSLALINIKEYIKKYPDLRTVFFILMQISVLLF